MALALLKKQLKSDSKKKNKMFNFDQDGGVKGKKNTVQTMDR